MFLVYDLSINMISTPYNTNIVTQVNDCRTGDVIEILHNGWT